MDHITIDKYIYKKSLFSTNDYLIDTISKSNPVDNICCYTFNQTKGKGQIGRYWFSDIDKNVTLSYLFHLKGCLAVDQFYLSMAVSLGVYEFFTLHIKKKENIYVKWPNDIYYENKKIAGILIQNQLKGKHISTSIIGIGLNINQLSFPKLPNPVSLQQITGKQYDLLKIVQNLEPYILKYLNILIFKKSALKKEYVQRLYLLHQLSSFVDLKTKEEFKGIINGITEEGKLLLHRGDEIMKYNFREVKFVLS